MKLPAGWVQTTLGEVATWGSGGTPKSGVAQYYGGDIPWILSGDLDDKPLHEATSKITPDGLNSSSAKWVPEGSVLIAMYGATIGKLAITRRSVTTNQAVAFATPFRDLMDERFLFWYLRSQRDALRKAGKGGAQPNISQTILKAWPVVVPPLAEQRRIVEALEDHLSRLDAAAASVINAKRRMRPLAAAILDDVALGVILGRGVDSNTARDSRKMLVGSQSKRFDYGSLAALPPGWFWRRASDVCDFISSGSTPKAHLMQSGDGEIPFLKVYNITQDGRIDFTNKPTYIDSATHENQMKRSRVRPGDVLTNIVGPPLGKTAVVPERYAEWNINQAIVAFRAGSDIHPAWLALVLRSPYVLGLLQKTAKATAGQFNVALSTCRELPLPVPPINIQLELVAQAAELLAGADRLAAQVMPLTTCSEHLRQAILRRAFTGQLVPQKITDEPASALLNRIRAEREARNSGKGAAKRAPRRSRKVTATADAPPPPSTASTPAPTTAVQQELPL